MDEKFLEFWGNFLISFAKGKKRANESSDMFQKNLASFNEFFSGMMQQKNLTGFDKVFSNLTKNNPADFDNLSATFRNLYGLDQVSEKSSEYNVMAKQAVQDFQKSFREYLAFTGYVPKEEHVRLIEKYQKIKEKCEDQEETIRHLKMLMGGKISEHQGNVNHQGDIIRSLQSIIKDQTNFFQKMMSDVGQQYLVKKETTDSAACSASASSDRNVGQKSAEKGEKKDDGKNETKSVDKTDGGPSKSNI